jgi:hypothetical protein
MARTLGQFGRAGVLMMAVTTLACAQHAAPLHTSEKTPTPAERQQMRVAGCIDTNFNPVSCSPLGRRPAPPQQIRIGKVVYIVAVVDKVPPAGPVSGLSGKTCDKTAVKRGWCDDQHRIFLEAGRTLRQEQTTLLHEIQHGILGTELSERETTYHKFIYRLSPKLLQVLQENPELYRYLTSTELGSN